MCGTFGFGTGPGPREVAKRLKLKYQPGLFDRLTSYKYTPRSTIPTVSRNSPNTLVPRIWWLTPPWADDPYRVKFATFNARSEAVVRKPAFRHAWSASQRCLIPASYFVEWETTEEGQKLPYKVKVQDADLFAFAGLYEDLADAEGHPIRTCTMLTTEAVAPLKKIHTRQPVILDEADHDAWLSKQTTPAEAVAYLKPHGDLEMERIDVGFNKLRAEDLDHEPEAID